MWSGGGEVKWFNWDVNQPNKVQIEQYGAMRNYKWHDVSSKNENFHFFCYSEHVHVVMEQKTWEEALEHCREHYKDLAVIYSEKNMTTIQNDLNTEETTEHVWIGLRFLAGDWFWLDGNKSEYEAWSSGGKPKCPGEKLACGALVSKGDVWEARNCEEKLHFICD
ncbi:hypothetical protein WMY93_022351 [Mugilogobius chulae]|uniref:C-type lectin domain-containing protein n=1 Tax=Mugilogobius chulae TaxID=88201 RepID=A0AAW0NCJ0_9GOBI